MPRQHAHSGRASTLSFWLLAVFLVILWIAGGASRGDVLGQAVVRFSAWALIVIAILALPRIEWRAIRAPAIILGAAILLVALQLVPLPPSVWSALPGRQILVEAATLAGIDQPWRPFSISPSGTANALASLVVPGAVLLLAANLNPEQHWRIATLVLGLAFAGAVLGLLQFSGGWFDNPFHNDVSGEVNGNFANRNHFALFLAVGCVLALAWAFRGGESRWKIAASFGMVVLFILMILATGSRSGVLLGIVGIALGGLVVRSRAIRELKALPRKLAAPLVAVGVTIIATVIWLSISLNRAVSIERAVMLDEEADLRGQIWPVVLEMIESYFPAGSGFGTFDPVFRISEPDRLLNPQYINLAHNDWLQIPLEGGLAGCALLAGALLWFLRRIVGEWNKRGGRRGFVCPPAQAGALIIILVMIASISDYPARTPLVMALLALAAVWLSWVTKSKREPADAPVP